MSDNNNQEAKCPVDHSTFPKDNTFSSPTLLNNTNTITNNTSNGQRWYHNLFWAAPEVSSKNVTADKAVCPVNHSSPSTSPSASLSTSTIPTSMSSTEEEKCPVDHSAREEWLKKIKQAGGAGPAAGLPPHHLKVTNPDPSSYAVEEPSNKTTIAATSDSLDNKSCSSQELPKEPVYHSKVPLPTEREISSIPRTGENDNWVYPSQKQFYEAMQRKQWNPHAEDMRTVVPIHNAVNERAWRHILMWEKGQGGDKCGGVKLTSFKGDSKKLTPRARWRLFLGYERPFDRHDWMVNRCGKEVEYVIDFYSGKSDPKNPSLPSFFLDVRPKLNSVEGWRLRVTKALGL